MLESSTAMKQMMLQTVACHLFLHPNYDGFCFSWPIKFARSALSHVPMGYSFFNPSAHGILVLTATGQKLKLCAPLFLANEIQWHLGIRQYDKSESQSCQASIIHF